MTKHFIDLNKVNYIELRKIVEIAKKLKLDRLAKSHNFKSCQDLMIGKNLAMIFEKNSTRTRVSFEVAINDFGGKAIVMNKNDMQLGKGESIADTAKVLSRFVDMIMIRSNSHETLLELARNSNVPVINGLSDYSHPCQIIASIIAIEERLGDISKLKLAWFGDINNVLTSYIHAATAFGFELTIAAPEEFKGCDEEINKAKNQGAKVFRAKDARLAATDADILITDTWFSMGDISLEDKKLKEEKMKILMPFQVNEELLKLSKNHSLFTHCLPAYREIEVTSNVIDSPRSIVFDEAENRLHAQKAILLWVNDIEL